MAEIQTNKQSSTEKSKPGKIARNKLWQLKCVSNGGKERKDHCCTRKVFQTVNEQATRDKKRNKMMSGIRLIDLFRPSTLHCVGCGRSFVPCNKFLPSPCRTGAARRRRTRKCWHPNRRRTPTRIPTPDDCWSQFRTQNRPDRWPKRSRWQSLEKTEASINWFASILLPPAMWVDRKGTYERRSSRIEQIGRECTCDVDCWNKVRSRSWRWQRSQTQDRKSRECRPVERRLCE